MKKVLLTVALAFGLIGSPVMAKTTTTTLPYFAATGAVVKNGKVYVTAPVGSDVQVDVDGTDLDVQITKKDPDSWTNVLPWNWNLWR